MQPTFSKQDFQDFWDAYPHRGGKKNRAGAEKAFSKAIKSGVSVAEIADGVRGMANDPDVQRNYARDPTTWLNQKGWTDEFSKTPQLKLMNGTRDERSNQGRAVNAEIANRFADGTIKHDPYQ